MDEKKQAKIMACYMDFENQKKMIKFEEEVAQLTGRITAMCVKEILLERLEKIGLTKGIKQGIDIGEAKKS